MKIARHATERPGVLCFEDGFHGRTLLALSLTSKAFTRYSPADQITRDNVKNLQIVWRRPAVDENLTQAFPKMRINQYLRSTPIMIDGMLNTQDVHGFGQTTAGEAHIGELMLDTTVRKA